MKIRYTIGSLALAGLVGFGSYQLRGHIDANRIDILESEKSAYETTIQKRNAYLGDLKTNLNEANSQISNYENTIDVLTKQNEHLNGKIWAVKKEISEITVLLEDKNE